MTSRGGRSAVLGNENVLSFVCSPVPSAGAGALELVYQTAEIFSSIENSAREIEARAQAMCKSAAERLRRAELRAESAENSSRGVIADADRNLSDASRALSDAERRVTAAEDRAVAAEIHAQVAEAEAREAKRTLTLVEDAIRSRLLCASPEAAGRLHEVA